MFAWIKRFETWSRSSLVAASIGIVIAVGCVDYLTGYETFFFVFYLLAVCLAAWFVSVSFGILISALSVTTWVYTNIAAGEQYSSVFVPLWNAMIMFAFYLVVVGLLARLRALHKELEERVRQRTAALTKEIQERTRLQKELLDISEREQRRIGRDLHDSLCQHLTGTALASHVLGQKLADKSLPETAEANRLVELVEEAIDLTRTLARGLHPVELQAVELVDNFQELAASASARLKTSCHFECQKAVPLLDMNTTTHLYRIVQEAITNAVRHGKAGRVNVCLDYADDEIILTVTDDGVGFAENSRNGNGMGLRIMAYRADVIGATFNIERLPTRGTRVTCALPAGIAPPKDHAAKN